MPVDRAAYLEQALLLESAVLLSSAFPALCRFTSCPCGVPSVKPAQSSTRAHARLGRSAGLRHVCAWKPPCHCARWWDWGRGGGLGSGCSVRSRVCPGVWPGQREDNGDKGTKATVRVHHREAESLHCVNLGSGVLRAVTPHAFGGSAL